MITISHTARSRRNVWSEFLVLIGLLGLTSCDASVDPVLETNQPFTLFGVLSPSLDTQRVLVFPIENTLRPLPNENLNAVFTTTEKATSAEIIWQDSLIEQANGEVHHMYWAPFTANFGATYLISVENEIGSKSTAEIIVPGEAEIIVEDVDDISDIILPVRVVGEIARLNKVEVQYGFDYNQLSIAPKLDTHVIPLDDRVSRDGEDLVIRINLSRDYILVRDFIQSQRAIDRARGIQLRGIQLRFIAANEEWAPPGGAFDPEILVQPGLMSNVENGFGFVGAGYRVVHNWLPADSIAEAAGFRQNPPD